MDNVLAKFAEVKVFVFDIDGVLTDGTVQVHPDGSQLRTFFVKDGWAIVQCIKEGFDVLVISAGQDESVRKRLEYLGVSRIALGVKNKLACLHEYVEDLNIDLNNVLYMGDDMPDFEVIQAAGLKTCPADASSDIVALCDYISPKDGGKGAVRDVIEKVLRIQGKWDFTPTL